MFVKIPIIRISILRSASSEPREKRVICHDILYIVSHFFFFFLFIFITSSSINLGVISNIICLKQSIVQSKYRSDMWRFSSIQMQRIPLGLNEVLFRSFNPFAKDRGEDLFFIN